MHAAGQLSLWPCEAMPAESPVHSQACSAADQLAGGVMAWFRHPRAERAIQLGQAWVAYECKRVRRRSIGMVVSEEGLCVRAPNWVPWADIEAALQSKASWICAKLVAQQERLRRRHSAQIAWREGGRIPFMGGSLEIVLQPSSGAARGRASAKAASIALDGPVHEQPSGRLILALPPGTEGHSVRELAQACLQRQARELFHARVAWFAQRIDVKVARVSLSNAKTRWGSASADGSVRLHWGLIHFSPHVIDYVVAHELAHLREMNHSPRFWAVVRQALPDFEQAREQLRRSVLPL